MLREVKNLHIKPRIVPFQITTAATPSATLNIGSGDFTVTRSAAGTGILTLKRPFSRNGLFFASGSTTNGGYAYLNAATASNVNFPYSLRTNAGAAVEGSLEGFVYGWDSTDVNITKVQRIAGSLNAPRIIWGYVVAATGALAAGSSDFTITHTAASGIYTIRFRRAFSSPPSIVVTPVSGAAAYTARLSNKTATGVTVTIAEQTPTLTDSDFCIVVVGRDCTSDSGRGTTPLQNSQRKPIIVAGQVLNTAGAWSCIIGSTEFGTIVDNGAGDFTIPGAAAMLPYIARVPAIVTSTTTQRSNLVLSAFAGVQIQTRAAGGAATDVSGVTSIFAIGSGDVCEY